MGDIFREILIEAENPAEAAIAREGAVLDELTAYVEMREGMIESSHWYSFIHRRRLSGEVQRAQRVIDNIREVGLLDHLITVLSVYQG